MGRCNKFCKGIGKKLVSNTISRKLAKKILVICKSHRLTNKRRVELLLQCWDLFFEDSTNFSSLQTEQIHDLHSVKSLIDSMDKVLDEMDIDDVLNDTKLQNILSEPKLSVIFEEELISEFFGIKNEYLQSLLYDEFSEQFYVIGDNDPVLKCCCCGFKTLESLNDFEVCPVCLWESIGQPYQDVFSKNNIPNPNHTSLEMARQTYKNIKNHQYVIPFNEAIKRYDC